MPALLLRGVRFSTERFMDKQLPDPPLSQTAERSIFLGTSRTLVLPMVSVLSKHGMEFTDIEGLGR